VPRKDRVGRNTYHVEYNRKWRRENRLIHLMYIQINNIIRKEENPERILELARRGNKKYYYKKTYGKYAMVAKLSNKLQKELLCQDQHQVES